MNAHEFESLAKPPGHVALAALLLLTAILIAMGNLLLFANAGEDGTIKLSAIAELFRENLAVAFFLAAAPFVPAGIAAVIALRRPAPSVWPPAAVAMEKEAPVAMETDKKAASADEAVRLLAVLQKEGRLVDFLQESVEGYSDEQIGAAVRAIHSGCRKALLEHVRIERILAGDEGSPVEIPAGFDPAEIRLVGNLQGQPPFRGTIQHGGWRVVRVTLPESIAASSAVIAPAEVEVA